MRSGFTKRSGKKHSDRRDGDDGVWAAWRTGWEGQPGAGGIDSSGRALRQQCALSDRCLRGPWTGDGMTTWPQN